MGESNIKNPSDRRVENCPETHKQTASLNIRRNCENRRSRKKYKMGNIYRGDRILSRQAPSAGTYWPERINERETKIFP